MVNIEPIQDFFYLHNGEHKKCSPPPAPPVPEGDGAHCDASALPVSGHTQEQEIRHNRNRGMPEPRGRRQAFAPKSGNENFVSGYRTFGGCYIITYCFYFPVMGQAWSRVPALAVVGKENVRQNTVMHNVRTVGTLLLFRHRSAAITRGSSRYLNGSSIIQSK